MTGAVDIVVRPMMQRDFKGIIDLTTRVYPESRPWNEKQLQSHLNVFPEGQLVAVDKADIVVGMAASLIIRWDDYSPLDNWRDFTDSGMFTNHDPVQGRTLYGAEVMVDPGRQGRGIGSLIYSARRDIVSKLGLLRIRAGARLRGYSSYADQMDARTYVLKVIQGDIKGPTLSFQLRHKFSVVDVVPGYLEHDPESLGYAALIEWVNRAVMSKEEYQARKVLYLNPAESDLTE